MDGRSRGLACRPELAGLMPPSFPWLNLGSIEGRTVLDTAVTRSKRKAALFIIRHQAMACEEEERVQQSSWRTVAQQGRQC